MPLTRAQQKALARKWKAAAPALRKQRHADIRKQDNAKAMDALNSIFLEALKHRQKHPRRTSGLVEMYKILSRGPKR